MGIEQCNSTTLIKTPGGKQREVPTDEVDVSDETWTEVSRTSEIVQEDGITVKRPTQSVFEKPNGAKITLVFNNSL